MDLHPERAKSLCHKVGLNMKLIDGVMVYYCTYATCQTAVARINPATHNGEWLDGHDHRTEVRLRRMVVEERRPTSAVPSVRR